MTKATIRKVLAHNRPEVAAHQIAAEFDKVYKRLSDLVKLMRTFDLSVQVLDIRFEKAEATVKQRQLQLTKESYEKAADKDQV